MVLRLRKETESTRVKTAPGRGREEAGYSSTDYTWTQMRTYDSAQYFMYDRLGECKPTTQTSGFSAHGRNTAMSYRLNGEGRPTTQASRNIISRISL